MGEITCRLSLSLPASLPRPLPTRRRPLLFAIPKAASPEHVEENARAANVQLDDMEIARIDQAFPRGAPARQAADAVVGTQAKW